MKAITYTAYGSSDVLKFTDVAKPTPKDNEILIKVHAASVNAADWRYMRGSPYAFRIVAGILKPKNTMFGADVAGRIEAIGKNVTQFQVGDEVFGDLSAYGRGAFAEYVCAPENAVALKPVNISFAEAAAVPMAALVALQGLRDKGNIQPGQKVVINGASGGVGTFAVQIAKLFGAEVTAICRRENMDMVRSIGADHVIDYAREDFTKNGQQYDLILAANGYHSIFDYSGSLTATGTYVTTGGEMAQLFQAMLFGPLFSTGSKKMSNLMVKQSQKDLITMKELIEAGKVVPVIDKRFALSEAAEAVRYVEEGHARGKVVIDVDAVYSATIA